MKFKTWKEDRRGNTDKFKGAMKFQCGKETNCGNASIGKYDEIPAGIETNCGNPI